MDRRKRMRGFTLVELLTVVAIISLLIGILLPSLSRARAQAKRVKVQAQLDAFAKGLEMFRNDYGNYPDSASIQPNGTANRADRVVGWPKPNSGTATGNPRLYGAHWLARALVGGDLRGLDVNGEALEPYDGKNQISYSDYALPAKYERRGTYIQLESARTTVDEATTENKLQPTGAPATGRIVLLDDYGYPVLYYRANAQAKTGIYPTRQQAISDGVSAVYYQEDNSAFTGTDVGSPKGDGWQFAGNKHTITKMGNYTGSGSGDIDEPGTFVNYLHNHEVHQQTKTGSSVGIITPYNAETFILLSAGADGIYGNRDDVKNFKIQGY